MARWTSGTRERLALALLLYTGQRRSDVVRMGRQHIGPGGIEVRQIKTGTQLALPLHPALRRELDQAPQDRLTFLARGNGQAFTANGFYMRLSAGCGRRGCRQGWPLTGSGKPAHGGWRRPDARPTRSRP
jgi:integrase